MSALTDSERETLLAHGLERFRAGNLVEAEEIFEKILAANAVDPDALHLLGLSRHQAGRSQEAIQYIEKAVANSPTNENFLNNLGQIYVAVDKLAEAVDCYRRSVEINPTFTEAHNNLANALVKLDALDEALIHYGLAIDSNPEYAVAHFNLGNLHLGQGRFGDAVVCFRRVIQIKPDYAEAHRNLGIALIALGDFDGAVEPLRRTLQINPRSAKALVALGGIMFEKKNFDEARRCLTRSATIDKYFAFGEACFFGDDFWDRADPEKFEKLVAALPEMTGDRPQSSGSKPVIMTSCDHRYFRTHGRALVLSVDRNAPGYDLHVHVINPDRSFDDEITALRKSLGATGLTVTTEAAPEVDRLYFHVIRFIRLGQIMDTAGRDFLHLDTDSLVQAPLDSVRAIDGNADLAIVTRFEEYALMHKVLISSLFVRQSENARLFMRRFGAYLADRILEAELAWGLDQAAFYVVYRMMGFSGEPVRLASLPQSLCDHGLQADSEVWAAKGELKENAAFIRARDRLLDAD